MHWKSIDAVEKTYFTENCRKKTEVWSAQPICIGRNAGTVAFFGKAYLVLSQADPHRAVNSATNRSPTSTVTSTVASTVAGHGSHRHYFSATRPLNNPIQQKPCILRSTHTTPSNPSIPIAATQTGRVLTKVNPHAGSGVARLRVWGTTPSRRARTEKAASSDPARFSTHM